MDGIKWETGWILNGYRLLLVRSKHYFFNDTKIWQLIVIAFTCFVRQLLEKQFDAQCKFSDYQLSHCGLSHN